jgi:chromosome segregation ATPase
MHVTLNERMLTAQLHKKEQEIKALKEQVQQYLASLRTMKDNLDEVKHLNKVLVNQISSLSLQLKQCPN